MSSGQTGHITGQMGRVPGTDGTHTRGCPAKILYVYWFFSFPKGPKTWWKVVAPSGPPLKHGNALSPFKISPFRASTGAEICPEERLDCICKSGTNKSVSVSVTESIRKRFKSVTITSQKIICGAHQKSIPKTISDHTRKLIPKQFESVSVSVIDMKSNSKMVYECVNSSSCTLRYVL